MSSVLTIGGIVREDYREACHGAGAAARWKARDSLEAMARHQQITVAELLENHNLDVQAYWASRPISRTQPGEMRNRPILQAYLEGSAAGLMDEDGEPPEVMTEAQKAEWVRARDWMRAYGMMAQPPEEGA